MTRAEATDAPAEPPEPDEGAGQPPARSGRRVARVKRPAAPTKWWELPVLALVAIVVAVLVKTFLVQPFYIPSDSMEQTLHGCTGCNGDKILVNKPIYHLRDPHPGDVVVFSAPGGWEEPVPAVSTNPISGAVRWFGQLIGVVPPDEHDLVKRVIATGGQTVRCCDARGRVEVSASGPDGPWRALSEPYVFQDDRMGFGPVTVPAGRLWVMGDHRSDSSDSRYHCQSGQTGTAPPGTTCDPTQSTVAVSSVIGKAFVIAWPYSRWRTLGTPATFTGKAVATASGVLPVVAGSLFVAPLWWRGRHRRR
ncbi:MAG: signal peptidase I [Actinomycetota bacterium]|nr:signal peptidase I [Actinomycetota bacterium]